MVELREVRETSTSLSYGASALPAPASLRRARYPDSDAPLNSADLPNPSETHAPPDDTEAVRHILGAIPAGVILIDRDGVVRTSNPAADATFGATLTGRIWRDVVNMEVLPAAEEGRDVRLRNGRVIDISTCALGYEPGQILLVRDVTEVRSLEIRLARRQRLSELGQMAASIAHQIRTPLATALLYATNLRSLNGEDDTKARMIAKAVERLQCVERLVDDLLTYSRQGRFDTRAFAVSPWLTSFTGSVVDHLEGGRVDLSVQASLDRSSLLGDAEALSSALRNLIDNAVRATPDTVNIELGARRVTGNFVEISVADDGPGIPESTRRRIFEPFYTTHRDGTGLGLTIVRGIVEAHRGAIDVAASTHGGALFNIRLPLIGPTPPDSVHSLAGEPVS